MGVPSCVCNEGYKLDGTKCIHESVPTCGLACTNGRCKFDFMGHPTCACNDGYKLSGTKCIDEAVPTTTTTTATTTTTTVALGMQLHVNRCNYM